MISYTYRERSSAGHPNRTPFASIITHFIQYDSLLVQDVHIDLRYIRFRLRFLTTNLVRTLCVFRLHALDLKAPPSPFLYICNNFFVYLVMTCTN